MEESRSSKPGSSASSSRRGFVGTVAGAAAGVTLLPRHVLGGSGFVAPSDKLNIAAVGSGGMGANNIERCSHENIVALCDVDEERAAKSFLKFPEVPKYKDFRVMLEKQKDIDAVIVATPDHAHALVAMMAIKLGKHVYVQKPMTRTVGEARRLTEAAREHKVASQMGNQGRSGDGQRLLSRVDLGRRDRPGARGPLLHEPARVAGPGDRDAAGRRRRRCLPLWTGTCGLRDRRTARTIRAYAPHDWRAWQQFGAGALGDMACHIMDAPFVALKLGYPIAVQACIAEQVLEPWKRVLEPRDIPHRLHHSVLLPRARGHAAGQAPLVRRRDAAGTAGGAGAGSRHELRRRRRDDLRRR